MEVGIAATAVFVMFCMVMIYDEHKWKREQAKKRYRECEVCGHEIELLKESLTRVRIVKNQGISVIANGYDITNYEVFVCERCGCQNVIKECFDIEKVDIVEEIKFRAEGTE